MAFNILGSIKEISPIAGKKVCRKGFKVGEHPISNKEYRMSKEKIWNGGRCPPFATL